MRLLVSGGSGFVGKALCTFLQKEGHEVEILSRKNFQNFDLEGFDGVIHLSGEKLSFGRWSKEKKTAIFESRVGYTRELVGKILSLKRPPSVFISASAIGFYGDRGDAILDEKASPGFGFLSHVCQEWEKASLPLLERKIRVVHTRFGIVLDRSGGALPMLLRFYKWGLGAILGSGMQWVSWVSLHDLTRALAWCLAHPLQGAVNIVSPGGVRQRDFATWIGNYVHRPVLWKIPAKILRFFLKEMGEDMLLASAHATPKKLLESGFLFLSSNLEEVPKSFLSQSSR